MDRPEKTPLLIVRPPWHRTAKGRRAIRAGLAMVAGAAIGTLCTFVPQEARELCRALARLASIAVGAG